MGPLKNKLKRWRQLGRLTAARWAGWLGPPQLPRHRFLRAVRSESGQIVVLGAISMVCLLGFLAFASDLGILILQRRNAQTAADAGALAAAKEVDWVSNDGTTVTAAARAATAQNGFTHGVNGVTVAVNNGPLSGPHAGDANFVEVIVQQSGPTMLLRLFNWNAVTVSARAVGGPGANAGCVYTLGTGGTDLSFTGSGSMSLTNCTMYDDSSDPSSALGFTGSGSISATSIEIVGAYSKTGSGSISPKPKTDIDAVGDPLAYLPEPTVPSTCGAAQNFSGSTAHSLTFGCYAGISNSGSGSLSFGPGLYVINGNLSFSGSGKISGSNVTFYVTGTTSMTGSGSLSLTAPTSGTYNGILYFQSRTDSSTVSFTGSGGSNVGGIFYAPDAQVSYTGSGSANIQTDYVVKSLSLTGSGGFTDYNKLNGESPLQSIVIVE